MTDCEISAFRYHSCKCRRFLIKSCIYINVNISFGRLHKKGQLITKKENGVKIQYTFDCIAQHVWDSRDP